MKHTKLLTTLLPLTCLGAAVVPVLASCGCQPKDEHQISFDETQKVKQVATWGVPLTEYTGVYTGFKFNKFTKEEIGKMTVSVENLSGFEGTVTAKIENISDTGFDVTLYFKPSWTYIEHGKVSFDLKFTSGSNKNWTKSITGFTVVFSNNLVTVTRDNEMRKEQKIYKNTESGTTADVVIKTDFEFWVNGQAADNSFLENLQINVPETQFNDVTITPKIQRATGGAIYVVLHIENFDAGTINYKFSFKNNTYNWESETFEFKLELTTDEEDQFEYYTNEDKQWIVRECNSCEQDITIPDNRVFGTDELITKIDRYAFHYCANMRAIHIGKNIKDIDASSGNPFYGCYNLEAITVDSQNAIYTSQDKSSNECNCVMDKEITKIVVGCKTTTVADDVKTIDVQAFNGCLGLEEIDLKNVTLIERGAFQGCTNLTKVTATNVDRMFNYAFSWCTSLSEIQLGTELTTLYHNVFEYCDSITELTLPNKISGVSGDCFVGCKNLEKITVDSPTYTSKPDGTNEVNGIFEKATKKLIRGCKSTEIPVGTPSIEDYAFAGCEFTSVMIPNTVTKLAKNAFSGCIKLSDVTIPESVTSIGDACFEDCYALSNVKINGAITELNHSTFRNCYILNAITIPETVVTIKDTVFENNYYMESITIPASVTTIYNEAFKNCAYLKSAKFQVTNGWIQNIIGKESQAIDPAELADTSKAAYYLVNKLPGFGWIMERK